MRRAFALLTAGMVVGVLAAACGSPQPTQITVTPVAGHQYRASLCASEDCGPYAAVLRWDIHWSGHTATGYYVYLNGTQEDDVAASPWVLSGMDCGTTYTLGVKAHDGTGHASSQLTESYTTPNCGSSTTSTSTTTSSDGQTTNCFSSPTACGYPDVATVGSTTACSSLTTLTSGNVPAGWSLSSGELQPTVSGTSGSPNVLSGYNFSSSGAWLYIGSYSYIKLSNDCFNAPGAGVSFASGYGTITQTGGNHLTVDHVTVLPTGCSAAYNQICAAANADNTNVSTGNNGSITNSLLAGGAESIHAGNNTTISGNYVNANGDVSGQHAENVYVSNEQGITVTANTMYNPFNQTAVIFGDSASACTNQLVVTGNLMAGGGWPIYWCGNATSNSTGTLTFQNNDLARCTTTPTGTTSGGTVYCGSTAPTSLSDGNVSAVGTSQDSHGFWPNGGGFGVDNYMLGCPSPAVSWSGNQWDDDGSTVGC